MDVYMSILRLHINMCIQRERQREREREREIAATYKGRRRPPDFFHPKNGGGECLTPGFVSTGTPAQRESVVVV